MIDSGRLTTRIRILEATDGRNEYGEQTRVWNKEFCKTRCGILKRSGRRLLMEGDVIESMSREIIIRWRPGINFRQRVEFIDSGEVFAIQHIHPSRTDGSITLQLTSIDD